MKFILILTITFTTLFSQDDLLSYLDDIQKINETIKKVLQETATDNKDIKKIYDPFYDKSKIIRKEKTEQKKAIKTIKSKQNKIALTMILNKKAFISGKWYKVNDKLDDCVISKIDKDIVILKKNRKYTTLKLQKTDSILIVTQEIK